MGTVNEIKFFRAMPSSSIVSSQSAPTLGHPDQIASTSAGELCHPTTPQDVDEHIKLVHIAEALYEKYIRRHCELEINISSTLRNRWDCLHAEAYPLETLHELIQVVDLVIAEMLKYIRQSFIRYSI